MDSLVFGTGTLYRTPVWIAKQAVAAARDAGIQEFDSAASYGSEQILGDMLREIDGPKVNSKFGLGAQSTLSADAVRKEVSATFQRLGLKAINILFLHSSPPEVLSDPAWDYLADEIEDGRIRAIGYSGDGNLLGRAIQDARFRAVLATFSIVDQGNHNLLRQTEGLELYLKRVLGSGVLSKRVMAQIRSRIREDSFGYQSRLGRMSEGLRQPLKSHHFLSFARTSFPSSKLVLGLNRASDVRRVIRGWNAGSDIPNDSIINCWNRVVGDPPPIT